MARTRAWHAVSAWTRGALAFGLAMVGVCAAAAGSQEQSPGFVLSSPTLAHGVEPAQRYDGPGCGGANVSPELDWRGLPPGTRSLALTVFDRDARAGAGWWHWAVADIPASATGLPLGAGSPAAAGMPDGARQLRTSFGREAYGGPCPPPGSGTHHYEFTLWALPVAHLELPAGAGAPELAATAAARAIATARMQVEYGR